VIVVSQTEKNDSFRYLKIKTQSVGLMTEEITSRSETADRKLFENIFSIPILEMYITLTHVRVYINIKLWAVFARVKYMVRTNK